MKRDTCIAGASVTFDVSRELDHPERFRIQFPIYIRSLESFADTLLQCNRVLDLALVLAQRREVGQARDAARRDHGRRRARAHLAQQLDVGSAQRPVLGDVGDDVAGAPDRVEARQVTVLLASGEGPISLTTPGGQMDDAMTLTRHARQLSNEEISARLDEVARLLEDQRANQYRVQAWRGGAETTTLAKPRFPGNLVPARLHEGAGSRPIKL